jgi:hypothetical protein
MLTGDSGISNSSFWLPPPLKPKDLIFCAGAQLFKMFFCPDFEVNFMSDFTAKRKGRFYSYFPYSSSNATFLSLDFSFTLPLFIASQKCIKSARNDASHVSSQLSLVRCAQASWRVFLRFHFSKF